MNKIITSLLGFMFMLTALAQTNDVLQVNSEQFRVLIFEQHGSFVDVRTQAEFRAEHIETAEQLNFYALDFGKKLLLLPKDKPVLLYCNTGYRSNKAAKMLIAHGYTQVYNLEHGIMEWNQQNYAVITGDKYLLQKENEMSIEQYHALLNSGLPVLVDFYAPWCGPCRKMMPLIDSLKTEYNGKIHIVKANSDLSKKLVKELKLSSVPYFQFFNNGELMFQKYGIIAKQEFISLFESNTNKQLK